MCRSWIRSVAILATVLLAESMHPCAIQADSGLIRLQETRGQMQVTIFTSPTPVRVGEVDISILVQDKSSGPVQHGVPIEIVAHPADKTARTIRTRATSESATNKLLQAATIKLLHASLWKIEVHVTPPEHSTETFVFDIEVASEQPRWATLWHWFTWPALVIILFAWRQWIVHSKSKK